MPITAADLEGLMFDQHAHYNMGKKGYGYGFRCQIYPRLRFIDRYFRPCREHPDGLNTRTYYVDGAEQSSIDAAAAALNAPPSLTEDERRVLEMVPAEFASLRDVEDDLAGVPRPKGAIIHDTPHYRVLGWLDALADKGMIEYGRQLGRSDEMPWDDFVPEHMRWSPTIRRTRP